MVFEDRFDAGRKLAEQLERYRGPDTIVLGLPRGGVVVAFEIAKTLRIRLEVLITHKIPAPGNPEYAIGAVAENGEAQLNSEEIDGLGIPATYIRQEIQNQMREIERRKQLYRSGRNLPSLQGRTAIIADDGVATGYTMMAALKAARAEHPSKLVMAVPVGPQETIDELARMADEIVVLSSPSPFFAVGAFYRNFEQTSDQDVQALLRKAGDPGVQM
jgi:putative phosphoribosyl transferase